MDKLNYPESKLDILVMACAREEFRRWKDVFHLDRLSIQDMDTANRDYNLFIECRDKTRQYQRTIEISMAEPPRILQDKIKRWLAGLHGANLQKNGHRSDAS